MDSVRVERLEKEGLVRVAWLPFELHPEAPVEGIPREAYFGRGRSEAMRDHMRSIAEEVGLKMESRDVIINSRRALGAAEFARAHGKFDEMHQALFKAHWDQGGAPGAGFAGPGAPRGESPLRQSARLESVDDLVDIGAAIGLDRDELRQALEGERYAPVIDEMRREAESVGINAIPAHIFGGRYLVLGAQPYEAFKQVLEKLNAPA